MEIVNQNGLPALYGSTINQNRAVAYCAHHKAYLTVATLKGHQCLCKNCNALQKQEHEYWRQREIIKAKKKENKKNKEAYLCGMTI